MNRNEMLDRLLDEVLNEAMQAKGEQTVPMLQELFKCVFKMQYNFHMIHWKCIGKEFNDLHNTMNEYYEKVNDFVDDVAELILMYGGTVPSFEEVASAAAYMVDNTKDYDKAAGFSECKICMSILYNNLAKVREEGELTNAQESLFDDMLGYLEKELYYKIDRRCTRYEE